MAKLGFHFLLPTLLVVSIQARADWRQDVSPAVLAGQGEFTFLGFHLYNAQLWIPQLPFDNTKPYALHLTYRRHIARDRLVESGMDEMRRILGDAWPTANASAWHGYMEQAFADVNEGDSITGVYLPAHGAKFYFNDKETANVTDLEFAKAFFSIWLGPDTRAPKLRAQLINTKAEN
jgi:hypothetical protein